MSLAKEYNALERLLHYLAFSNTFVQKTLCELENDVFRRRLQCVESTREVFVTGLPRAGTTLILELLYATGEFATFTYRNMPFILAPLLWQAISAPFRTTGVKAQRAHGDGMLISFDSPEAFEEVIWLTYLRKRIVDGDHLNMLSAADLGSEFTEVFSQSIRKLIGAGGGATSEGPTRRYLSKNNANISRIGAITALCPEAVILVPFREPLAHVGSLMAQHRRFLQMHGESRFSRRYMQWIGHFEFGANFKPIDFDGWLRENAHLSPASVEFWLTYWMAAYSHVLAHGRGNLVLVDFDKLLREGAATLEAIAESVGLHEPGKLIDGARTLRAPTTRPVEKAECPRPVLEAAEELHRRLQEAAI